MTNQMGALWIALRRANAGTPILSWWDRSIDTPEEIAEADLIIEEAEAGERKTMTEAKPCMSTLHGHTTASTRARCYDTLAAENTRLRERVANVSSAHLAATMSITALRAENDRLKDTQARGIASLSVLRDMKAEARAENARLRAALVAALPWIAKVAADRDENDHIAKTAMRMYDHARAALAGEAHDSEPSDEAMLHAGCDETCDCGKQATNG